MEDKLMLYFAFVVVFLFGATLGVSLVLLILQVYLF